MLAITETWLRSGDKDKIITGDITPAGYKIHHVPRCGRKGGGVAVVLRSEFTTKKQKIGQFVTFEAIELSIVSKKDMIRLSVIYRPPSSNKNQFLDEFQEYLDSHTSSKGKFVVLGDFNFHFNKVADQDAKKLRDLLFSLNFDQHVEAPTHTHGHLLDLLLTRSSEAVISKLEMHPPIMSDHTPLTFSLVTRKPPPGKKLVSFRKLRNMDMDKFKMDIQHSSLLTDPPTGSTDDLVQQYNDTLTRIIDEHAPLKTKYITDRENAPWYNEAILQAKRDKRKSE